MADLSKRLRSMFGAAMHRGLAGSLLMCAVFLSGMLSSPGTASAATWTAGTEAELQAAISGAASGDVINLTASISLTSSLPVVNTDVTINGGGFTVDGGGTYQAFFVNTGNVSINNMTITNCVSQGGDGGSGWNGGGGGLGAGGAIFVNSGATVSVSGVSFTSNNATGGNGGGYVSGLGRGGGGGGGYGGDGLSTTTASGGNGGGFRADGAGGTPGGGAGGDFQGGGGGNDDPSYNGGNGGFGGGGGAGGAGGGDYGGAGGFGGGAGGGDYGDGGPGTGGGDTTSYGGGGGAGFGGAVFVRDGGSLTITDGGFSGNTAVGGLGYASQGGQNGSGEGQAMYLMSGVNAGLNVMGAVSIVDTIGGAGSISKSGAGTLTLSGANTYTGGTTINDGTLTLGASGVLADTGAVTVNSPGVFNVNNQTETIGSLAGNGNTTLGSGTLITGGNNASTTYSGVMSGTGGMVKQGTGNMTLSGANTYTGGTTINDGTLTLGASSVLHDTGAVTVNSPGVFNVNGQVDIIGSLAGSGGVTLGNGSLFTGWNNADTTYSGVMSGTGSLLKIGTGAMTLSGANTFSGSLHASQGTVRLGASGVLDDMLRVYTYSTGILDLNDQTETIGSLAGDGGVTLGSGTLTTGGNNADTTYSGVMSGTGGMVKEGTGVMTLSGYNTYTGDTRVSNGTLRAGNNFAISSSSALVVDSAGVFDVNGYYQRTGSLSGSGSVLLSGSASSVLETGLDNTDTTFAGVISGPGALIKTGTGAMTLSGANTFSYGLYVNNGTLRLGASGAITDSILVYVLSPGTFDLNGYDERVGSIIGDGAVALGAGTLYAGGSNLTTAYSGVMSGTGGLVKEGLGTLTLSGANTYTGGTTIDGGTLTLGASGVLADTGAVTVNSPGVFDVNSQTETIGSLAGDGNTTLGSGTLITGGNNADTTYSGVMSGTGGMVKQGTGNMTLSGANTYSGGTTINDGTLTLGASSVLHDTGAVTVNSPGVFDVNSKVDVIGSLAGSGGVTLGSGLLITGWNNADTTYSGVMSGIGSLLKIGTGAMTLSGANTFSGSLHASQGTVRLGASGVLDDMLQVYTYSTGILDLNGQTETIGSLAGDGGVTLGSGTLTAGGNDLGTEYYGVMSGTGGFVKEGTNVMIFYGANTYTGGTTINGGTLSLSNSGVLADAGAVTVNSPGVLYVNSVTETIGSLSGNGNVTFLNGTLYTGGNNADTTYSGVMSGYGLLVKEGVGTMTLSGVNTYSRGTVVNNGTLRLGASGVIANTCAVTVNAPGIFDLNGNSETIGSLAGGGIVTLGSGTLTSGSNNNSTTYSGVMSGTGGFVKEGLGSMYMTGANTYTGLTSVAAGNLFINGSIAGGASVNAGGCLGGSGTIAGDVNNSGVLAPGNSIGTLSIGGNYTQGATGALYTEIDATGACDLLDVSGTATLGGSLALADAGGTYGLVTNYTLLSAGGGLGGTTFGGLTNNLPSYLNPYVTYDASNVYLQVVRNDVDFSAMGGTYNQSSAGGAINRAFLAADAETLAALDGIFGMTPAQQAAALDSLTGEVHTAVPQVALGFLNNFMATVNARFAQAGGYASNDAPVYMRLASAEEGMTDAGQAYVSEAGGGGGLGLWLKGGGVFGDASSDGNAHDYDYSIGGTSGGLEFDNGRGIVLGAGAGYGVADVNMGGNLGNGGAGSTQASLYAGYCPGPLSVELALGYAHNRYHTNRRILATGDNARASYSGDEYSAMAEAGYALKLAGLDIVPLASFQWTRLETDAFTESGAGGFNLDVDGRRTDSLKPGAGLRVSRNYSSASGWNAVPELRGKWTRECGNNDQTINARFAGMAGASFPVHGLEVSRDSAVVGAGLSIFRAKGLGLSVDYDAELHDNQTAHALTGEVKYVW